MEAVSSKPSLSKKDFDRVLRLVRRVVHPPIDAENLASEILYASWTKNQTPSRRFIFNRCFSAIRSHQRHEGQNVAVAYKILTAKEEGTHDPASGNSERVKYLQTAIEDSHLSMIEMRVMHLRYWQACSFEDIAHHLNLKLYKVVELHNSLMSKLRLQLVEAEI